MEIKEAFKNRRNNMLILDREGKTANIGDIRENFWSVPLYSKEGMGSSYKCRVASERQTLSKNYTIL